MDIPSFAMFTGVLQALIFWGFVLALILGLAIGPRYLRSRERQRLYDMMKVAYEKGQPVPPEILASLTKDEQEPQPSSATSTDRDLRRAIVLIAVGLGIAGLGLGIGWGISMASDIGGAITGGVIAGVGAIPGFIGVAYLILWLVGRSSRKA